MGDASCFIKPLGHCKAPYRWNCMKPQGLCTYRGEFAKPLQKGDFAKSLGVLTYRGSFTRSIGTLVSLIRSLETLQSFYMKGTSQSTCRGFIKLLKTSVWG